MARLNGSPVRGISAINARRRKKNQGPWRGVVEHQIVENARVVTLDCGHRVLRSPNDFSVLKTKSMRCEVCGKAGDP